MLNCLASVGASECLICVDSFVIGAGQWGGVGGGGVARSTGHPHNNGEGESTGIFAVWCWGVTGVESTRTSLRSPEDWGRGPFTEAGASLSESIHSTPGVLPLHQVQTNWGSLWMDPTGGLRSLAHFHFNAFQTHSKVFRFQFCTTAGRTLMRPSLLVPASSPIYAHHTGDELRRQVPHCSEWQFAFWKSGSGSFVLPEIELAHQLTLNNSLLSPPPTSSLPHPLLSVTVCSFHTKAHIWERFHFHMSARVGLF